MNARGEIERFFTWTFFIVGGLILLGALLLVYVAITVVYPSLSDVDAQFSIDESQVRVLDDRVQFSIENSPESVEAVEYFIIVITDVTGAEANITINETLAAGAEKTYELFLSDISLSTIAKIGVYLVARREGEFVMGRYQALYIFPQTSVEPVPPVIEPIRNTTPIVNITRPHGTGGSSGGSNGGGTTDPGCEPFCSTSEDTERPHTPANISISNRTNTSITFTWSTPYDNVGVLGYYIFRNGSEIDEIFTAEYTDLGLLPNTTYTYEIVAYDESGLESNRSTSVAFTTLANNQIQLPPPAAPSGVQATTLSSSGITVSWLAGTGEDLYKIEQSTSSSSGWNQVGTVGMNIHTYAATGLLADTLYYFRVRAHNTTTGDSAYSSVVSNRTRTTTPISGQPTCQTTGSNGEGWYVGSTFIMADSCVCIPQCKNQGTSNEGYYDCVGQVIVLTDC